MIQETDVSVRGILLILASPVLATALQAILQKEHRKRLAPVLGVLGALLLLASFYWPSLQLIIGDRLAASAASFASDFRVWLSIVLIIWLYAAISLFIGSRWQREMRQIIEKDIIPFRLALERWVIPRRLTEQQINSIAQYLAKFRPSTVSFKTKKDDEEADFYRGDLHDALNRGGWKVLQRDYVTDVKEGLTIHVEDTPASAAAADDPRQPKPSHLLFAALKQAEVQVDGSSGSSGTNIFQDAITISVGTRKRSHRVDSLKWPF